MSREKGSEEARKVINCGAGGKMHKHTIIPLCVLEKNPVF
jgi:hypothetical protein